MHSGTLLPHILNLHDNRSVRYPSSSSPGPAHEPAVIHTTQAFANSPEPAEPLTHLVPRILEPDCSWCSWWEVLTPSRRLRSARALPVLDVGPPPITLSFSIWCWAICRGLANMEKRATTPRPKPMVTAVRKANPLLAWEMTPSAVVTEEGGRESHTGSASACAQRSGAPVRTARPDHHSFYLVAVLGNNWLAEMLETVLLAGKAAARASVLLRSKAGTKETSWMTCCLVMDVPLLCIM